MSDIKDMFEARIRGNVFGRWVNDMIKREVKEIKEILSVKELNIYDSMRDIAIIVTNENEINFKIQIGLNEENMTIDRRQAHLLMLWLQEHLK